jgi:serralysin
VAFYTDPSPTRDFNLSGNTLVDLLYDTTDYFRVAWNTVVNGKTVVTYSFPFANGVASKFDTNYGNGENTATTTGAISSAQMPAVAAAFQAWANVANLTFSQVNETAAGQVGDIRIAYSSAITGGYWGYTLITSDGADNSHGDIWIGTDQIGDNFNVGTFNYVAMMHEIGHALGLAHPFDSPKTNYAAIDNERYTIMSYTSPDNVWFYDNALGDYRYLVETPMVYDIAAIQKIYGANTAYHSGNDTYTYTRNDPFFATIWDGGGQDTIDLSNFTKGCTVDLTPGSYSTLGFSNTTLDKNLGIAFDCIIENVVGGAGNDSITGNSANNLLRGGTGNDTYFVQNAGDIVKERVGEGSDTVNSSVSWAMSRYVETLNLTGSAAINGTGSRDANTINGNSAANVLSGGDGDDTLNGLDGADKLVGGLGRDVMTGGAGADRFIFRTGDFGGVTADTADEITDFSHAERDRISLSAIDANTLTGTVNDAFAFIGSAAFGHHAGELRYEIVAGTGYVQGDTNGDGLADFWIRIDHGPALVAGDFVL